MSSIVIGSSPALPAAPSKKRKAQGPSPGPLTRRLARELLPAAERDRVDLDDPKSLLSQLAEADQEEVAALVRRYDLLAIPVVDVDGRMLGVITVGILYLSAREALDRKEERDAREEEERQARVIEANKNNKNFAPKAKKQKVTPSMQASGLNRRERRKKEREAEDA